MKKLYISKLQSTKYLLNCDRLLVVCTSQMVFVYQWRLKLATTEYSTTEVLYLPPFETSAIFPRKTPTNSRYNRWAKLWISVLKLKFEIFDLLILNWLRWVMEGGVPGFFIYYFWKDYMFRYETGFVESPRFDEN